MLYFSNMLFKEIHLEGIRRGKVSLAFRKWKRPTVKTGTALRTKMGVVNIMAVDEITQAEITDAEAQKSGYASKDALMLELKKHTGQLYRIKVKYGGEDPRIALREDIDMDEETMNMILQKMKGMDERSDYGAWTKKVLQYIGRHPEELAANMALAMNMDKHWMKTNIRKLKELGLTESMPIGYRLSPRGEVILAALR